MFGDKNVWHFSVLFKGVVSWYQLLSMCLISVYGSHIGVLRSGPPLLAKAVRGYESAGPAVKDWLNPAMNYLPIHLNWRYILYISSVVELDPHQSIQRLGCLVDSCNDNQNPLEYYWKNGENLGNKQKACGVRTEHFRY